MRAETKLILRATVMKQITEVYEIDCTGMDLDEVKAEMNEAYVEDRFGWAYVHGETDHHEIETKLELR